MHAYSGPNQEADSNKLCYILGEKRIECRRTKKPTGFGQPFSVKAQQHLKQNQIEGQFQEYSDTYAIYRKNKKHLVERRTEKVDLTKIEDIAPVYLFIGGRDQVCKSDGYSLLKEFGGSANNMKIYD